MSANRASAFAPPMIHNQRIEWVFDVVLFPHMSRDAAHRFFEIGIDHWTLEMQFCDEWVEVGWVVYLLQGKDDFVVVLFVDGTFFGWFGLRLGTLQWEQIFGILVVEDVGLPCD